MSINYLGKYYRCEWHVKEEEFAKAFVAMSFKSPQVINYDNTTRDLQAYSMICQYLTSGNVSGRLLGKSEMIDIHNRSLILSSGNNNHPCEDLKRRCLEIRLDTKQANNAKRNWGGDPLKDKLRPNRARYVCAILNIINAYMLSKEKVRTERLNSFDEWVKICVEPLVWLSVADPLAKIHDALDDNEELCILADVTAVLQSIFSGLPFLIREIGQQLSTSSELRRVLLAAQCLNYDGSLDVRRMGCFFKKNKDIPHSGRRLVKAGTKKDNASTWQIEILPNSNQNRELNNSKIVGKDVDSIEIPAFDAGFSA